MSVQSAKTGRTLIRGFGVFLVAAVIYAVTEWIAGGGLLAQILVIPARMAIGILHSIAPFNADYAWLDVDIGGTSAFLKRSLTFGATALFVFVPTDLYRRRPTRLRLLAAIFVWSLVILSWAAFILLIAGMESGWRD